MTGDHHDKSSNKMRYFDDDGYRQRAACICVRSEQEDEVGPWKRERGSLSDVSLARSY